MIRLRGLVCEGKLNQIHSCFSNKKCQISFQQIDVTIPLSIIHFIGLLHLIVICFSFCFLFQIFFIILSLPSQIYFPSFTAFFLLSKVYHNILLHSSHLFSSTFFSNLPFFLLPKFIYFLPRIFLSYFSFICFEFDFHWFILIHQQTATTGTKLQKKFRPILLPSNFIHSFDCKTENKPELRTLCSLVFFSSHFMT